MKPGQRGRIRLLVLCYGAVLLVWLGLGLFGYVRDAARRDDEMAARQLLFAQADDAYNLSQTDGWDAEADWWLSWDSDPQLVWQLGGEPVGRLVFRAEAVNAPGGELVLYYTTRQEQGFSERRKVWAQQAENGEWVFELGGKRVYALRLDPGTDGGVIWRVDEILLNAPKPGWAYFVPDAQRAALLLLLPPLLWGLLWEVWAFVQPAVVRRRFESRWKAE